MPVPAEAYLFLAQLNLLEQRTEEAEMNLCAAAGISKRTRNRYVERRVCQLR